MPRVAEELHILTPPDHSPGKRRVLGPEPDAAGPTDPDKVSAQ
ncbi:hypothetical protein [Streptomyces klenkii]